MPPMARSAQLTPFLTKLRSSRAAASISGRRARKSASSPRPCNASDASSAKAARRPNSSSSVAHSSTLAKACGTWSKSLKQTVSTIAQLSKSARQRVHLLRRDRRGVVDHAGDHARLVEAGGPERGGERVVAAERLATACIFAIGTPIAWSVTMP